MLRFRATSKSSALSCVGRYVPVIFAGVGTLSWGDAHPTQLPVCCGTPQARPGAQRQAVQSAGARQWARGWMW